MTFYAENETSHEFEFPWKEIYETVALAVLDSENCPYESQVNLLLTDNEGIHAINKEFREMDRPTDVLSFPMLNYTTPGDFAFLDDEDSDDFNPDTGEALLGDIVISVEKVYEQAESFGHSVEREYAFLITHSMLHLFGYDHMEEDEAKVMEEKQKEILNQMNILR